MKARSLNRFLKLMKCSLMPRKGDYMITKEENRQLKKVEQEVVLASPWTSLICFFGGGGRMQRERRGKNVVHQLISNLRKCI